jgi:ATP-dependent DNA helicase Rep
VARSTTANGVPPWSEFCILFRGNHQSRALEKSLQLLRIPYHLSGGTAFLDRGEVKDAARLAAPARQSR